jgi:hypothetical protein
VPSVRSVPDENRWKLTARAATSQYVAEVTRSTPVDFSGEDFAADLAARTRRLKQSTVYITAGNARIDALKVPAALRGDLALPRCVERSD